MTKKNTLLTFVMLVTLGLQSSHGMPVDEREKTKTIRSVAQLLGEEGARLEEKLRIFKKIEENPDHKKVEGYIQVSKESLQSRLKDLTDHVAQEFQTLTGLMREERTENLKVNEAFHERLLKIYRGGFNQLLEIQKTFQDDIEINATLPLIQQRMAYYEGLMDIYAQDSEAFDAKIFAGGFWSDSTRRCYLRNPKFVFLTVLAEEEKEADEALQLLNRFSVASEKLCRYDSEALRTLRSKVFGELTPIQLQKVLERGEEKILKSEWEEVSVIESSGQPELSPESEETAPKREKTPVQSNSEMVKENAQETELQKKKRPNSRTRKQRAKAKSREAGTDNAGEKISKE